MQVVSTDLDLAYLHSLGKFGKVGKIQARIPVQRSTWRRRLPGER